ncbi:hypothetical protein LTR56_022612 [Elasticomyces elasticus]|nr:hypothetical protein LTR56_022612 [Elasticomyces elasticus]KAK3628421.1 hypothetical protein LTR22_022382 [Elasticomyces elasticus]KAK4907823.1 hypothetical protein LTR49_023221 [Elasticomyces elasticus]KAK5747986.1 hypothetical protein LTS12_021982 [Elasticomyces elasticus]
MSATVTTTTTAIPLHVLPAQPGGPTPAPTAAPVNSPAPVATAHAAVPQPAANNAPVTIPHAPGSRNRIVPKFKASTWLGMALAAAAIAVTVYYGQVMLRLARWSAGNEFRGSCVNDRSVGISSSACNSTLSEPARPPPVLRKRTLLLATVYSGRGNVALMIAVTATAGVVLLIARYTLFRKHLEARALPVIGLTRWAMLHEKHPRKPMGNVAVLQRERKQHWTHDTWGGNDAEEASFPYRPEDYGSSDNETVVREVLSKALRKAQTAILLDGARNFEAALKAYTEASRLLQYVIDRSSLASENERMEFMKLRYTVRIEELKRLDLGRPPASFLDDLPDPPTHTSQETYPSRLFNWIVS